MLTEERSACRMYSCGQYTLNNINYIMDVQIRDIRSLSGYFTSTTSFTSIYFTTTTTYTTTFYFYNTYKLSKARIGVTGPGGNNYTPQGAETSDDLIRTLYTIHRCALVMTAAPTCALCRNRSAWLVFSCTTQESISHLT